MWKGKRDEGDRWSKKEEEGKGRDIEVVSYIT